MLTVASQKRKFKREFNHRTMRFALAVTLAYHHNFRMFVPGSIRDGIAEGTRSTRDGFTVLRMASLRSWPTRTSSNSQRAPSKRD